LRVNVDSVVTSIHHVFFNDRELFEHTVMRLLSEPSIEIETIVVLFVNQVDTLVVVLSIIVANRWDYQSAGEVLSK
jgi:hypothetical protein